MLPYLRSELFRLRRRRMMLVLLLFIVLIPILVYLLIYTSTLAQLEAVRSGQVEQQPGRPPVTEEQVKQVLDTLRPDRAPQFALGFTSFIGAIFATILAGSVTGNDFGWATIRTILAHGGRRGAYLGAKLVALIVAAAALVAAGFAATFLASYAISIPAGIDLSLSADVAGRTAAYMIRALYATVPYVTFALLMAVVARSAAAGIAFGLVLLFGESLLSQVAISLNRDLRPLFDAGISRNVQVITRTGFDQRGLPELPPPPGELPLAVFILALYVVAFMALAVHRLAKRDVTLA